MNHITFNLHLQTFVFKTLKKEDNSQMNRTYHKRTYYTEHQRKFCIVKDSTTIKKAIPQFHSKYLLMMKGSLLATKHLLTSINQHQQQQQQQDYAKFINDNELENNNSNNNNNNSLLVKLKAQHVKAATEEFDDRELKYKNNNVSNSLIKIKAPMFTNALLRSIYN